MICSNSGEALSSVRGCNSCSILTKLTLRGSDASLYAVSSISRSRAENPARNRSWITSLKSACNMEPVNLSSKLSSSARKSLPFNISVSNSHETFFAQSSGTPATILDTWVPGPPPIRDSKAARNGIYCIHPDGPIENLSAKESSSWRFRRIRASSNIVPRSSSLTRPVPFRS